MRLSSKHLIIIIRLLDWAIFLGLFSLAIYFIVDVILVFNMKLTGMAQSLVPIKELPSISWCFIGNVTFYYDLDFHIDYEARPGAKLKRLIPDESYYVPETGEVLMLEQLTTECFKFKARTNTSVNPSDYRGFKMYFRKNISLQDMPRVHELWITSEDNSYGKTYNFWHHGLSMKVKLRNGDDAKYTLAGTSKEYLGTEGQCSPYTFEEQWKPYVLEEQFIGCGLEPNPGQWNRFWTRCTPFQLPYPQSIDNCPWPQMNDRLRECTQYHIDEVWHKFKFDDLLYKRHCASFEFIGVETAFEAYDDIYHTEFAYKFASPEFYMDFTEFLRFDPVALVGSIGGTLGIYIGFSVSGTVTSGLEMMKIHIFMNERRMAILKYHLDKFKRFSYMFFYYLFTEL